MALASGTVSYQRFLVDGRLADDISDEFVAALNRRSFARAVAQSDSTQFGWIGPTHLFETDLVAERIAFGAFAHLAVRLDRARVPSNVLRSYIRMEEETALEASGREYLSKGEKRAAKETALQRAERELAGGAFRRMQSYPVVINLQHKEVLLGNTGAGLADRFMQLFADTFGAGLKPADPDHLAARLLNNSRALENLAPAHFVRPPADAGEAGNDLPAGDLAFLGKEFLTWLWFQTDADRGALRVRDRDDVTVMIDKTVRLKCDFGLTGSDVITADSPTALPEAAAALRAGKQPVKMGLVLGGAAGEFRCTLDGPRLTVSGLQVPEDGTVRDVRARLESRFELITDAAHLLDGLFELFLVRRTGRDWAAEHRRMSTWAAGKGAPLAATA